MDDALQSGAHQARDEVARGTLRGDALRERLLAVPSRDRDAWIDVVLGIDPPPPDRALPHGSVPYLPCGVEEIIALVREAPLRASDALVDIGAGVGRAVILAHLLSGARACGIEIQEHMVASAKRRSAALGLDGVSFAHADATTTELDGSVFFLYAPCNGSMLTRVLDRLEATARRRPIVVCTVDLELRDVAWLRLRESACISLSIYDAKVALT